MATNTAHVNITATDKTKAAFASATRNLEVFNARADNITTALSGIARFGAAGGALVAFGAAAAVSGGAMLLAAKNAIDLADNLNDLSQKTGISVEQLAGLRIVAEQSGTSLEAVGRGFKNLQVALVDASVGQGDNLSLLKQLGLVGLTANEAFLKLADTFQNLADEDQKAAIAQAIFKKVGVDLIPVLNQGTEALKKQVEIGAQLSGITTENAKAADKFNDQMRLLKASLEGFVVEIVGAALPSLNRFFGELNKIKEITGSSFGRNEVEEFGDSVRDVQTTITTTSKTIDSLREKLAKAQDQLGRRPVTQVDRRKVDAGLVESLEEQIKFQERRLRFLKFRREQEVQDDPLLKQGAELSQLGFDDKKTPAIDFGKARKASEGAKGGKTIAQDLAEDVKKLQTEAGRLDFVIKNFDSLSKSGRDAEVALAQFETTAGRFKGLPGADKLRKAAEEVEAGRIEVEALKTALDQTQEANKLNFLVDAFEELGPAVFDSHEAIARFQVQARGLENTRAGEKLIQAGRNLDAAKKSFDFTKEFSRLTEDSRQLIFTEEQIDKLGVAAEGSQRALVEFRIQTEGIDGTELAEKLRVAADAFDVLKASASANRELRAFNEDLEDTAKRIADIETFGQVNPFNANARQAERQIAGPLKFAEPEVKNNLRASAGVKDISARRESVSQFIADQKLANAEIAFQTTLLGKSAQEQERLTALHRIDVEERRLTVGASGDEFLGIRAQTNEVRKETESALAAQAQVQRSFQTGWSEAFESFRDDATNSATFARDVFSETVGTLKGGISDILSGDFDNVEDRFKTMLDNMVAEWLTTQIVLGATDAFNNFFPSTPAVGGDAAAGAAAGAGAKAATGAVDSAAAATASTALTALSGSATAAQLPLSLLGTASTASQAGLTQFGGLAALAAGQFSTMPASALLLEVALQTAATAATEAAIQFQIAAATTAAAGGFAKGGVFTNGSVVPFASGGLVSKPTFFPMSGNRKGLMGEAGTEAIMPTAKTASGKLGVRAIDEKNKTVVLPFTRDSAGRLAVKKFEKGGVFDDNRSEVVRFARGGILDEQSREFPLELLSQGGGLNNILSPNASGKSNPKLTKTPNNYTINVSIATPDISGFRRSQATLVSQLTSAMNAARAKQ